MPDDTMTRDQFARKMFPCERCGARPGEYCRSRNGGIAYHPHVPRMALEQEAWNEAQDALQGAVQDAGKRIAGRGRALVVR